MRAGRDTFKAGGAEPAPTLRAETLAVVRRCADEYGFGSLFATEQYLLRAHAGADGARIAVNLSAL